MFQKREQTWWLAACVSGLLVAAWAAGGFIGPLMAVFIVLFLAGAVLIEFEDRDRSLPDPVAVVEEPEDPAAQDPAAGPELAGNLESDSAADLREAADSLA